MRAATRLLASVKPGRFLEAGSPTGLTGLFTHPAPRSALMYIYSSTLDKLSAFPESSVYRQSVENLTKHRLAIVSAVVPVGFEEWSARVTKTMEENPDSFAGGKHLKKVMNGRTFVTTKVDRGLDELTDEWDGETDAGPELEGVRTAAERATQASFYSTVTGAEKAVAWEAEPPLTAEQIGEIENKIGAGLIEEVIEVAEGELKLIDVMSKAEVWADLEEKPVEGQWTYFSRDTATGTTQAPPTK